MHNKQFIIENNISQNGIFMVLITVAMHIFIILLILISQFCEQTNLVIPMYNVWETFQ